MAEYAFAAGCYEAYRRICLQLAKETDVGACREDGLATCDRSGRDFGDWVRNKKGAEAPLK